MLKQVEDTLEMLDMLNDVHAEVGAAPERSEWRDYPPEALRRQIDAAALAPVYCGESAKTVLEALSTEEFLGKSDVARRAGMPPRKAASLLRNLVQDGLVEARGATRARVYRRRG